MRVFGFSGCLLMDSSMETVAICVDSARYGARDYIVLYAGDYTEMSDVESLWMGDRLYHRRRMVSNSGNGCDGGTSFPT